MIVPLDSYLSTPAARGYDAAGVRRLGASRALGREASDTSIGDLRTEAALGRHIDASDPGRARQAATLMVSQLFFAPLLAEARKSSIGGEIGGGGRGEEVFGEQLDMRIADTVAGSLHGGLTDQIESRLAQRGQAIANQQASVANSTNEAR